MNTEDRQTGDGASGDRPAANVVRLPTDWLGPRDELVPIGAAARPVEAYPLEAMPPTAEDFWSEQSASVHGAIQGPGPERDPGAGKRPAARRRRKARRGPIARRGPMAQRWPGRDRSFYVAGFAIVAAAALGVTALTGLVGPGFSPGARGFAASRQRLSKVATAHVSRSTHVGGAENTRVHAVGIPRSERISSHQSHTRTRRHMTRRHTVATQPVHYTPPAPAPTRTSPSTTGAPATGGGSGDSSGGAAPSSPNPPNGPIGAGAPFTPGQLG